MKTNIVALTFSLLLSATSLVGQQRPTVDPASKSRGRLQPSPVTINMPFGMTKDQADGILAELRQIRLLLEKHQAEPTGVRPTPLPTAEKVSMSVSGGWYSVGRPDAPVTMVEFADYQCPFCRHFHTDTFAELKKNFIDTGKVLFVSRDLPLDFHENSQRAAEAARCAGDQGKYWEMRNALITNGSDLSADAVTRYAQSLSLNMTSFSGCVSSATHKAEIQKDQSDAGVLQISGTPTFVLGRTSKGTLNGTRLVGAQPYATFEAAILQLLTNNVQ